VCKYLQTTQQQIPEDDHVDVNKVLNTPNFDPLFLITKHVDLKVSKLCFVLLNQYCSNDKIKKNEIGRACSAYGGEDPGIDGRIILRWIFRKWEVVVCTGSSWLRRGTGSCECGNEPLGSILCREFPD
jgi:hypothetical protein